MKNNKYNYLWVIQQNYGSCGWEDVSQYDCDSTGHVYEMSGSFITLKSGRKQELTALGHDLKEYKLLGYPTRVIFRREIMNYA